MLHLFQNVQSIHETQTGFSLVFNNYRSPFYNAWRRSGIFIVNFEHISHLVLVFLRLTLSM